MDSTDKIDDVGSSHMQIIDPQYDTKRRTKRSTRWCVLLLVALIIIAVIAGATVGILKAIQSSESSG
jgi:heme A synthase